MGEVYRARDEQLDRDIAIKVLPAATFDNPTARARLMREARAAAALNHPNICTVHEVGEADGQAYIAMELVEGQTLNDRLTAGALPAEQTVRYGVQLADALAHAHDRGVVHRDLKSANVIVTPEGRVKVLDFGLAKRLTETDLSDAVTQFEATFTQQGTVMGTLAYMAPEQLRGQIAQAPSDVWALGVVLYEMAQGTRPFQGQTGFELSAAILNEALPPLSSSVSPTLRAVIARCLEKEPAQRYKNGSEVRAALDVIQTGELSQTPPPLKPAEPVSVSRPVLVAGLGRRQAIWLGVIVAVGLASGIAAWRLWPAGVTTRSLAVLPLENRGKDEDLEYLCDGVAESLIQQISRLRSLRVIHLSTVLNFKGQPVDARAAGKQLGVDTILSGSIERQGARLLISARLVDVATGRELWTSSYDRSASDLLDVQNEIASAIMNDGLRLQLSDDQQRRLVRRPTVDGDAYDLYLQARYLQRRATEEDYLYSRELLLRAVVRDPKFALALAALSGNYAMMVTDGLMRPTDAWPQVNRYMRQALAIDPDLPDLHAYSHAVAFLFDWDWAGAERERRLFLQSAEIGFDPQVMRALAVERWALGRPDEALQLSRRLRELDPLSPYLASAEADFLLRAGQFDAAIALYENAIRLDPSAPNAYFGLAEARYRQGRFDEAIDARRLAHAAGGDDALKGVFATARGEQGYREIDGHGCGCSSRPSRPEKPPTMSRRWTSREPTPSLARRN